MMHWKNYTMALLIGLASLLPVSGSTSASDELTVITENYPPLNFVEDGVLQGASVDIVRAIMESLKEDTEINVYPWQRGYKFLESRKNVALFSTTRTPSRESLFNWVGPLAEKKIGLFARQDWAETVNNLNDIRNYKVGVQRDGVGMQYLRERGFKNLDASSKPIANLKKLMAGRNDLWFASNATVAGNCKKLGISTDELKQVFVVENTFMYIAFSKATSFEIVDRWQAAFDRLRKEGVIKDIFMKHDLSNLYPKGD